MDLNYYLQHPDHFAAIQSFHRIFQVKRAIENSIGCKISFEQFGEIIELTMSRPSLEGMRDGLSRIIQGL